MEKLRILKILKSNIPDKIIVKVMLLLEEITEELILRGGVDIVKVGIGPGAACTTRLKNWCRNATIICYRWNIADAYTWC